MQAAFSFGSLKLCKSWLPALSSLNAARAALA
jgi:hypothetical protein